MQFSFLVLCFVGFEFEKFNEFLGRYVFFRFCLFVVFVISHEMLKVFMFDCC